MNDAEFQKLLSAEPPLVLNASMKKNILLCISGLIFTVGAVFMAMSPRNQQDIYIGWSGAIFFGFGTLLFFMNILNPRGSSLTLNAKNFVVKTLRKEQTHQWKDVSEFVANSMPTPVLVKQIDATVNMVSQNAPFPLSGRASKQVFFNTEATGRTAEIARKMTGYNAILLASYGELDASQLAQLMNHWRERALKPETASSETNPPAPAPADPPTNNPPHPKAPEGW